MTIHQAVLEAAAKAASEKRIRIQFGVDAGEMMRIAPSQPSAPPA